MAKTSIPAEKRCIHCKEIKPITEYYKNRCCADGHRYVCKDCLRKYMKTRYERLKSLHRSKPPNKSSGTKKCTRCKEVKPRSAFPTDICHLDGIASWCKSCGIQKFREIKREVLSFYGGGTLRCVCCEETMAEFLVIDHIDGGGHQHRKKLGKQGVTFYIWLKKNGFPPGYQTLCDNCNMASWRYGHCPHQCDHQTH